MEEQSNTVPVTNVRMQLNGRTLKEHLEEVEYNLISNAMRQAQNVVARAADLLGCERTTLCMKIRKYRDRPQNA